MSVISSVDLKVAPTAATYTAVVAGGGTFTSGSYVEFVAATGAVAVLNGIATNAGGTAGLQAEIDLSTGAGGAETVIGTIRVQIGNPGAPGPGTFLIAIPLSGVANGGRIALRTRASTSGASLGLAVYYAESWDGDSHNRPLACTPSAAVGTSVTPHATGWNNSSFAQLNSSMPVKAGLSYITIFQGIGSVDFEIDLATGAAASESVITTLRGTALFQSNAGGALIRQALSAIYEVAKNARVSYRLRKSGTDTASWVVDLGYYELLPSGKGGGKGHKGGPGITPFPSGGAAFFTVGNFSVTNTN